ncbi:MAG TPA: RDD family protein [Chlamydiales bacterium]|jgi:uncharacterized RDD family membrane protein YckC
MTKAIEPTEILVDAQGTIKDHTTRMDPWIRFWGRLFDYALFCSGLWTLRVATGVNLSISEMWVPSEYLLWIPIETILLATFGTTPGKWLLNTEIVQGRRRRLEWSVALKRSFSVWLKGIGLGIPVINAICLLVSYQQLIIRKISSWDIPDHIQITHRNISRGKRSIVALLAALGLILYEVYGRNV